MQPDLFGETRTGSGAVISECGTYRYRLWRTWADAPVCCWVMLNPSTADASVDDPTIRKCIGYSRAWGYGGLVVVNLFAVRSPDPEVMKRHAAPVGPENDRHLTEAAQDAALVVCAWGADGGHRGRAAEVRRVLKAHGVDLHALRLGKTGEPWHPLYLPGNVKPEPWGEMVGGAGEGEAPRP